MGTLATYFRREEFIPVRESAGAAGIVRTSARAKEQAREAAAQYQLRGLPNDDVYFFCKRIDNSRLVRQADPQTKGQCWSAIGATCILAVLAGSVMAPKIGSILAGYKLQQLRQEQRVLLDERRSLEVDVATLLSPSRLDTLAQKQKLNRPAAGQVVHLQPKADAAVASVVVPTTLKVR